MVRTFFLVRTIFRFFEYTQKVHYCQFPNLRFLWQLDRSCGCNPFYSVDTKSSKGMSGSEKQRIIVISFSQVIIAEVQVTMLKV